MVDLQSDKYTYEFILADMLEQIPSYIDKREGSIIYNALAPAALKLAEAYFIMQSERDLYFLDTTEGEYLTKKCSEYGITRRLATHATRKGTFKDNTPSLVDVPIGARFRIEDTTYMVRERISEGVFQLQCEQPGVIGNNYTGTLLPLDNNSNVAAAILDEILIYGEDIESDDDLRMRTKDSIVNQSSDGNINQYLKWANDFDGIGIPKVFPLALGPNTVKVSITNSNNQVASTELIKSFQDYIDPGSTGLGNGKAPIGAKVTVTTGNVKTIDISGNISLNNGFSQVVGAEEAITNYLSGLTYRANKVSYIGLASVILGLESVSDVSNILINGAIEDISLLEEDIPTLGTLSLVVV